MTDQKNRSGISSSTNADIVRFGISDDPAVMLDLGFGDDTVIVDADKSVEQVRLTFTSSEVGNGVALDSNTMANQDGGLAVRMQAEDGSDMLVGPISRFDDEGISFVSDGKFTFDVRDLVSGTARGDQFDVVTLGTNETDRIDQTGEREAYYINAGMGDDRIVGGRANDFLVGGAGNDLLTGHRGDDSFIGGGGNDTISGGLGADTAIYNIATDGSDTVNLGKGMDTVNVSAPVTATQVRLTFTSAEVGDGRIRDSGAMTNQDSGLAVRMQAEDGLGNLTGTVARFDDEGISFVSTVPGVTFDVRDLVSGTARGDQFDVVELGSKSNNKFDETGETAAYYINAGMGDDRLKGGVDNDFLVGGVGNDRLNGGEGNDSMIGGADADTYVFAGDTGNDSILDFISGTDKIDLVAFDIDFTAVETTASGTNTLIGVDTDDDDVSDFEIMLVNAGAPVEADYLFA